jgi:membrane protein YqaA with SNARE-associated domain
MSLSLLQSGVKAAHHAGKHASPWLNWLVSLGGAGLFIVALVDSSVFPVPIPGSADLLLLLLTVRRASLGLWVIVYPALAVLGSSIGGYTTWSAGWKGGEVTLERYVPKKYKGRINGWVEKYGVWSVAVAAILPPPIPMMPFLLAAGALKVPRWRFLLAFTLARTLRFGFLAWLGVSFGRHFVHEWRNKIEAWSTTVLWAYGVVMVLGIAFAVWKMKRGNRNRGQSADAVA